MRSSIVLLQIAALGCLLQTAARADSRVPAPRVDAQIDRCAAALERARRSLADEYALLADAQVTVDARGARFEFVDGDCMHHLSGSVDVARSRRKSRGWRFTSGDDRYEASIVRRGLSATIVYYDHNESESASPEGLQERFTRAFVRAIDECL